MTQASYTSGFLFTKAHKLVRARIYTLLGTYGLTPSDWSIVGITASAPEGTRLATVAKQMDVKAPLITMLADSLVEKGLITRVPHPTDGRVKLLVVTPKGKKLAKEVEQKLNAEITQLMNGVNVYEAVVFQKTLETIIANAESL